MQIRLKEIDPETYEYLVKRGLLKKFLEKIQLLQSNLRHASLHVERLEPKEFKIYSFRIDKKYRTIFVFTKGDEIAIIKVTTHYR